MKLLRELLEDVVQPSRLPPLKEEHDRARDRFRFTVVVDVDAEDAEKMDEQRIHDEINKAIKKGINSITAFEIQKFIVQ